MMPNRPALVRLRSLDLRGIKLGLSAIDAVCERLGRPERRVPGVLVAGTNGKGSTAATLAAIATAAGVRGGLYTSPHLVDVTERIRIGGDDIAPEELDAALGEVFAAADRAPAVPVTYFEAMTAAAFVAFARRGLELAILEVGLGGRLDATNVAPASLAVVTSISLDHVEDLGPTVAKIASEKAGIFRAGRPALVASRLPEALAVFDDAARQTGAELHRMVDETRIELGAPQLSETRFRLTTPERIYDLATPLAGAHQADNAATAVRAAALAAFIVGTGLAPDLVFGAMADKDIENMGAALAPVARRIRFVPAGSPRGAEPEDLSRRFAPGRADAAASANVAAALDELLADPSGETIIVAGSLYLVGEARSLLQSF